MARPSDVEQWLSGTGLSWPRDGPCTCRLSEARRRGEGVERGRPWELVVRRPFRAFAGLVCVLVANPDHL